MTHPYRQGGTNHIDAKGAAAYNVELGHRLRSARLRAHLSMRDVAESTNQTITATSLGAYERSNRRISPYRLAYLAQLYNTPVANLIPDLTLATSPEVNTPVPVPAKGTIPDPSIPQGHSSAAPVELILIVPAVYRSAQADPGLTGALANFVRSRGGTTTQFLTLNPDEVRKMAVIYEMPPDGLVQWLQELELAV